VREIRLSSEAVSSERASFAACIAAILELELAEVPEIAPEDELVGWRISRWLGGLGLGLVPIADVGDFSWAGPWIGMVRNAGDDQRRAVVMYGVPPGVAWDPARVTETQGWRIDAGWVVAALDVALARPTRPPAPVSTGTVDAIYVAAGAGQAVQRLDEVAALAGRGLVGDRHVDGKGTFPSGLPGSALTLIEAEVCESFDPPLGPDEHRRNIVTRGIDLNALVGREFAIGDLRCRGMRLCEPCRVVDGYATRPVLRALVHRGGLRADILADGTLRAGAAVRAHS
jgi:MOSC domain-containing protein YiiM